MLKGAFLSSVCFHYVRQKESVEQWSKKQPKQFLFLLDDGDNMATLPEETEDPVRAAREKNKVAMGIEGRESFLVAPIIDMSMLVN